MKEKRNKKETVKALVGFGYSFDEAKKTAYQVNKLNKDLATFNNPRFEEIKKLFTKTISSISKTNLSVSITEEDIKGREKK